jgi:hypothetical protein
MHQTKPTSGCAAPSPGSVFDGMRRSGRREKSRGLECRRVGSWRRSNLPEELLHCIRELLETLQTVGVSEREIGRIHAMCRSIRPRRDPALTIRGRFGLVSNESADTTSGEHCRCHERLSHRSGRRLTSFRSEQSFNSHTPPFSFCIYPPNKPFPRIEQVLMGHKAVTAWVGHFTRVVSGAGPSPSI